jgi:hypothetical protein
MDNQPTTKPIIYVDASALKESNCNRRFIYTILYGFTNKQRHQNYTTAYGSAYHKALEMWYSREDNSNLQAFQDKCITAAQDYYAPYAPYISTRDREWRTPTHLVRSLKEYFKTYNVDAELMIPLRGVLESKFALPYKSTPLYDIVLCGTIDGIFDYQGEVVFMDHKTTSSWDKEKFFEDYNISVQMMFYRHIIEKLTGRKLKCVINGIFGKKQTQASEKAKTFDGVIFERSRKIDYEDERMEEFLSWLYEEKLIGLESWLDKNFLYSKNATIEPNSITMPNFSACHPKWGCPYFNICTVIPSLQARALAGMSREPYEPLKFGE